MGITKPVIDLAIDLAKHLW